MPSRYDLPHIDIAGFASEHDYIGQGGYGNPVARERAEHGRRLKDELDAALLMADVARPSDARLDPVTGTLIEVELRRGKAFARAPLKPRRRKTGSLRFMSPTTPGLRSPPSLMNI
jgi:hypothetical protein